MDREPDCVIAHWVNTGDKKTSGYYCCSGRYEVIFGVPEQNRPGKGTDEEVCKFCRHATSGQGVPIGMPTRRFGNDILQYVCDSKGQPRLFGGIPAFDVIAWRYGEDKFKRIAQLASEKAPKGRDGQPDIRYLDLQITCSSEQFQKMTIDPCTPPALWTTNQSVAQQAAALYKQNRHESFDDLLAQKVSPEQADKLIALATGESAPGSAGAPPPIASPQDLQNLLDNAPVPPVAGPTAASISAPMPTPGPIQTAPAQVQQGFTQLPPLEAPTPSPVASVATIQQPQMAAPVVAQAQQPNTIAPPPVSAPTQQVAAQPPAQTVQPAVNVTDFDKLLD
jgi:hypothetical protein